jgi:hypothetical protein
MQKMELAFAGVQIARSQIVILYIYSFTRCHYCMFKLHDVINKNISDKDSVDTDNGFILRG